MNLGGQKMDIFSSPSSRKNERKPRLVLGKMPSKIIKTGTATCLILTLMISGLSLESRAADFENGIRVYRAGDFDMAIRYFRRATVYDAENPNLRYYLADSLVKKRRFYEAQSEYHQVIAMAPTSQAAQLSKMGLQLLPKYNVPIQTRAIKSIDGEILTDGPDKINGLTVSGTDYLNEIAENGLLVRWSVKQSPIKLYIEQSPPNIRHFEPGFILQVRKAMDAWMNALGNQISYVIVDTPDKADIRVLWVNTIDTKGFVTETGTTYTAGVTLPNIQNERLTSMDVKLGTFDIRNKPQSVAEIYLLALHELGHALGLRGHSEDSKDIMFAQNQNVSALSKRDINTIRLLYGQEVDITNLPQKKKDDPEREKRVATRLDEEIKAMETQVKTNGSHLNWNNLGSSYFQKGKSLKSQGADAKTDIKEDKKVFYDKAIDAFDKAIKLEPLDASTYYNRCIVYQEIGKLDLALIDVESAIKNDLRENKYYLEKAWILSNMKRKSEAQSALDAYLIRDPNGGKSESVQKIRLRLSKL